MLEKTAKKTRHLFSIGSFRKQWQTSCIAAGLDIGNPERQLDTYAVL